ncbi:hypothetical protein [Microbulbifer sp. GL-2]|uniref:hypothetical protein n=1 Tax=Microbulbifer sp. GL-2 TaxID=2591606 RepID=UPI001165B788|nr:hypothetical protein [Microbulbifer sp. GL-2]BBM01742.1 hypothetical protein GL2_18160 [Microbulbifer sp. GL-2]
MNESLKLLTAMSLSVFLTACGGFDNDGNNDGNAVSGNKGTGNDKDTPAVITGGKGVATEDSKTSTSGQLNDSIKANQTFEESELQGEYGNLEVSRMAAGTTL